MQDHIGYIKGRLSHDKELINRRALIVTSKCIQNMTRQPQMDPAVELHVEILKNKGNWLAYKPQNISIDESTALGFLPSLPGGAFWAQFLKNNQFFLVVANEMSLSYLNGCDHIAMDATHNSCDVSN